MLYQTTKEIGLGGLSIFSFRRWRDGGPTVLHADDRPAVGVGFVQRLVWTRTLHVAVLGTLLGLRIFREFSGLIT